MSHLHIVLHQRTDAEDDIFKALGVLHAMDKAIHRRFTLGQVHLSVFVPISLISVHGIHIVPYLRLTLEEHLRQRIEGIVGESRIAHHQQVLQQLIHVHLCYHIVLGEYPLAIVELGIFLLYLHILHPVHVGIVRHIEITFLHVQTAVGKHIELATEAEVLTVGWDKLQVIAQVALHIHRVFYIIMVEADGSFADR